MIQHLSYPDSQFINDFMEVTHYTVTYSNIDQGVGLILKLGKGTLLSKTDIKSIFRLLPITPSDFELLSIKFENQYVMIKCFLWARQPVVLSWKF